MFKYGQEEKMIFHIKKLTNVLFYLCLSINYSDVLFFEKFPRINNKRKEAINLLTIISRKTWNP